MHRITGNTEGIDASGAEPAVLLCGLQRIIPTVAAHNARAAIRDAPRPLKDL